MGRMKVGTLPTPRATKGCYLRMRVDGRVFNLGKVGSKAADDRRKAILAAWGAHGGTLPADFKLDAKKPRKTLPKITKEVTAVLSVGDLVEITLSEVGGGKTPEELRNNSRWWRLRCVADVLQPYFTTPAVEFGPRLLALPTLAADTTIIGKVVGNRLALSPCLSQSLRHATSQKNS